mgnify:CR=1 FL=1
MRFINYEVFWTPAPFLKTISTLIEDGYSTVPPHPPRLCPKLSLQSYIILSIYSLTLTPCPKTSMTFASPFSDLFQYSVDLFIARQSLLEPDQGLHHFIYFKMSLH